MKLKMLMHGLSTLEERSKRGRALAGSVSTWTDSGNGKKLKDSVNRWTESGKAKKSRNLPDDMR